MHTLLLIKLFSSEQFELWRVKELVNLGHSSKEDRSNSIKCSNSTQQNASFFCDYPVLSYNNWKSIKFSKNQQK